MCTFTKMWGVTTRAKGEGSLASLGQYASRVMWDPRCFLKDQTKLKSTNPPCHFNTKTSHGDQKCHSVQHLSFLGGLFTTVHLLFVHHERPKGQREEQALR